MGNGNRMWMDKYEQCGLDLAAGHITRAEAETILADLGFDQGEVEDHLDAVQEQAAEDNGQFGVGS